MWFLKSKPEAISSGGVVARLFDGKIKVLLLRDKRYEDWTLPKGHLEGDETLEQTALREVSEEAGVTVAKIVTKLDSYRRFSDKAKEWKTIHYFLLSAPPDEPKGALESDNMETAWFRLDDLPQMYLPEQERVIKDNLEKIDLYKKDLRP